MSRKAQLADGTILEFPDDTTDDVIDQTVRKHLGVPPAAPVTPPQEPKPSLFRNDSDFQDKSGVSTGDMLWATARDMFGSRQGAAEHLAQSTQKGVGDLVGGGAKVVQDENGEPLVELADGTRYRMNDPGLDVTDVANVTGNVAAMWTPAGWAAKFNQIRGLGLGARAVTQGVTAGATDAALQLATEGTVDAGRTATVAAAGSAGEVLGTALGGIASRVKGLLETRTTQKTAYDLAMENGLPSPSPEVLERLAKGLGEIKAGADPRAILGREEFGFLYTQGQRMAVPNREALATPAGRRADAARVSQLSREEMQRSTPGSMEVFDRVNRENTDRLGDAVTRITDNLGGRPGASPSELVADAGTALTQQADDLGTRVSDAYAEAGKTGRSAISADAARAAPDRIAAGVRDFGVNPRLHPAAAETLAQLRAAAAELPAGTKGVTLQALETQRRIINANYGAAQNSADRAAMQRIKREFDGFMDEAIETALISGDAGALEALKKARGLRAEFGRRFEGKEDTDRFIAGLVDGSRTPEELVNMALGASQVSKAGGARFVERLRLAAADDPAVMGNLRAAHFMRLSRDRAGAPLKPGDIVKNINATEYNAASIAKALYGPAEWAQVRRLANALEPLLAKGDMAKSSGTAERLWRFLTQKMSGSLPMVGNMISTAAGGVNAVQAGRAINAPLRPPSAALPGFVPMSESLAGETY